MVEFAGWEMPITYGSILQEHRQVRDSGGMFDVSHMGRVHFRGQDALRFLERICTRRIHDMAHGQCRYSLICNERGGVKDDVLIYRYGDDDFLLIINAANRAKLLDHFAAHKADLDFVWEDRTEKTAMLALQGPRVMDIVARFSDEIPALKRYRFCVKSLFVFKMTISRTGYTGEDGVEVILPANMAATAANLMLSQGGDAAQFIKPTGLGARDTLRTEAGMPLYGHEMDEDTDPISAGLVFGINLDKDQDEAGQRFIGQDALQEIHQRGPENRLVGLLLDGKRTARPGMPIYSGGDAVGRVTSACLSPTLERPIAMGYVPSAMAEPDTSLQIQISRNMVDAIVTPLPFYKRKRPSK